MKTTMKCLTYGLIIFTLVFTSCSKDGEVGPIGPAGSQGTAGTNGVDGTNGADGSDGTDGTSGQDGADGTDGNADIRIFEYDSRTFTTNTTYQMTDITQTVMSNSLVLAYYGTTVERVIISGNAPIAMVQWKPVPGIDNLFIIKSQTGKSGFFSPGGGSNNAQEMNVKLLNFDGTSYLGSTTFEQFKIIVAPSNIAGKNSAVDLRKMTYEEVMQHFGLEE